MNRLGRIVGCVLLALSVAGGASPSRGYGACPSLADRATLGVSGDNVGVNDLVDAVECVCSLQYLADYIEACPEIYPEDEYIEAALMECERDEDGCIRIGSRLWELLFGGDAATSASEERRTLLVGGAVFGTRIKEARVTVVTPDDAGILREGDRIISINGKDISSIKDVKDTLASRDGGELSLVCQRSGRRISLSMKPKQIGEEWRLGAVLREGAAGLGTITYIDPETGEFGGLGHGICDPDTGEILEMSGGVVTEVVLGGVVRGEGGKPGELSGILTDRSNGEIYTNTDSGVFGKLTKIPAACTEMLPIAYRNEVKSGKATIISTLKNGKTMEYSIEIFDVKENATGTKCFKIKVTDPALLAISGGIVRGMSGSPIKQDGRLVGAVTHVMVADPTEGYGIFIENMLSAAQGQAVPKAA